MPFWSLGRDPIRVWTIKARQISIASATHAILVARARPVDMYQSAQGINNQSILSAGGAHAITVARAREYELSMTTGNEDAKQGKVEKCERHPCHIGR